MQHSGLASQPLEWRRAPAVLRGGNVLALDVGGTRLKWGVVDADGCVVCSGTEPSRRGVDALSDQIAELSARHRLPLALAIAGDVRNDGVVTAAEHLGITAYDPAAQLQRRGTHAPAVCVNDAAAACTAEAAAVNGCLAYISVGTGVGGSIAVDGRVIVGATGAAGEIGHMPFTGATEHCPCGGIGCIELFGGWAGMRERWKRTSGSDLSGPADLLALASDGDANAGQIVEQALDAISRAAACLVATTDPAVLRLGGGVSAAWGEAMVGGVRRRLPGLCYVGARVPVELSPLGDDAALIGAALMAGRFEGRRRAPAPLPADTGPTAKRSR